VDRGKKTDGRGQTKDKETGVRVQEAQPVVGGLRQQRGMLEYWKIGTMGGEIRRLYFGLT